MSAYADTGFVISLFLQETTSEAADRAFAAVNGPVLLSPLSRPEIRNALNLAIAPASPAPTSSPPRKWGRRGTGSSSKRC